MKSVVFSGSIRFYDQIEAWAIALRAQGVTVEVPKIGVSPEEWDALSPDEQRTLKRHFIDDHNLRIDRSDVLFVFNAKGYVGNSVTLEIGYAHAKDKQILALHPDDEMGRDVLYAAYCVTPQELMRHLAD